MAPEYRPIDLYDTLADGRTFRTLNVVDDFTREALALEVGRSIPGARVVRVLVFATVTLESRNGERRIPP